MGRWGVRRTIVVGGAGACAVIVAACSGGSSRVTTAPTTRPSSSSTVAGGAAPGNRGGSTTVARAKPKAGAHASAPTTSVDTVVVVGASTSTTLSQLQKLQNALAVARAEDGGTSTGTVPPVTTGSSPATAPPTTAYVPKPYDPTKPIDLGGVPGVTPAEQARAEQLVRDTLRDLPRYASESTAYADGYRSVGDGFTGTEHYVKWSYVDDQYVLDSKHPESLVYQLRNGSWQLVSAMYILPTGVRFANAPDIGGALTQWHVHGDLCFGDTGDPLQKVVSSITTVDGSCPPGTQKFVNLMIHVWIVANPCGPFAPLDGIGGGQPPPGQQPLCDTTHGSG